MLLIIKLPITNMALVTFLVLSVAVICAQANVWDNIFS